MPSDCSDEPFTGKASDNAALWTLTATEQFTIAGRIPVHVRAKVDDVSEGDIPMSIALLDVADEPFDAFAVSGSVGHEIVKKGEGNSLSYNVVRWTQDKTNKKTISTGHIDLRNPEAGYEPATATRRVEPIEADTYYDYTVWLDPTYYTVQPGHRLELYIVPFLGWNHYPDTETRDYMLERMGLDPASAMNIRTDYSFTIENEASFATLPVVEEVGYMLTAGEGETWSKGGAEALGFAWKRTLNDPETFRHFAGVEVDGQAVDPSSYTATPGSAVVSLAPAYLETLPAGGHSIVARFDDGNGAPASFAVAENGQEASPGNPDAKSGSALARTGDGSPAALLLAAAFSAGGASLVAGYAIARRKRDQRASRE